MSDPPERTHCCAGTHRSCGGGAGAVVWSTRSRRVLLALRCSGLPTAESQPIGPPSSCQPGAVSGSPAPDQPGREGNRSGSRCRRQPPPRAGPGATGPDVRGETSGPVRPDGQPGGYSIRRPEMAREITSCWICSVPSKMSKILASRCMRSTGYSRVYP